MQKIKNYCEFHIKGLNQERFFNDLSKFCVVQDISRYERNKTSFKVPLRQCRKVKKLILNSGFEIIKQAKRGVLYKLFSFRKRYGILTGIVLCVVFYFIQLPLIWQIKIEGVSEELSGQVRSFILDNFEMNKVNIDTKEIEISLRNEFQNLSFASVIVVGQSLVVNAKEGLDPNEMTGEFEAIVSEYDCKIVKIKLIQGTLAVEAGDVIRKGDVIVYPYIIDSYGKEKKVEPKVEVTVECWIEGQTTHLDEEILKRRTGNTYVQTNLELFGQTIYSHNNNLPFQNYEREESEKYFSTNNILPFVFRKITYYETEYVTIKQSYESVRANKIASAREKALQKLQEYDIITEERYVETSANGVYYVTYRLTTIKEFSIKWNYIQHQKIFF